MNIIFVFSKRGWQVAKSWSDFPKPVVLSTPLHQPKLNQQDEFQQPHNLCCAWTQLRITCSFWKHLLTEMTDKVGWTYQVITALRSVRAVLFRSTLLSKSLFNKYLWRSFLEEHPHSHGFLCKRNSQEWERLLDILTATWLESSGFMWAGEGAGGVSHGKMCGDIWGGDGMLLLVP